MAYQSLYGSATPGHTPRAASSTFPASAQTTPTMAPMTVEKVKRHPTYYLQGGDVIFLVQSYLFRVHRYFFERESAWFREKLGVPAAAGQPAKGSSDANPFPLDDVNADDFARFLWVFYNPIYSIYDATVDDWEAILKQAYDWRFAEVKKLCCRELEKFVIEAVRKIAMYQAYDIDKKLLIPSYTALTLRRDPISIREGRQLGLETAMLLATARESARGPAGMRSPTEANINEEDLVSIIKEVFGLTQNAPSTPPLSPVALNGTLNGIPPLGANQTSPAKTQPAAATNGNGAATNGAAKTAAGRPQSPTTAGGVFQSIAQALGGAATTADKKDEKKEGEANGATKKNGSTGGASALGKKLEDAKANTNATTGSGKSAASR
ncbi:hypothetical protein C8Q75DRAFT_774594 [Abortiporus biennis]|nr:hypothetical protein C8Q75DRAFT_774594 [Abortiporus biennis]